MSDATVTVTLYTQPGCVDSGRVRRLLRARGVPFVERDVSRDADAAAALARTGIFATPVLVVTGHAGHAEHAGSGERAIFGYRPAEIAAALAAAGPWPPDEDR